MVPLSTRGCWGQTMLFFKKNCLIKTKRHNLLNRPPKIWNWNWKSQSIHLSETSYFVHFNEWMWDTLHNKNTAVKYLLFTSKSGGQLRWYINLLEHNWTCCHHHFHRCTLLGIWLRTSFGPFQHWFPKNKIINDKTVHTNML